MTIMDVLDMTDEQYLTFRARRFAARIYAREGYIRAAIRILRGEVDDWGLVRFGHLFLS